MTVRTAPTRSEATADVHVVNRKHVVDPDPNRKHVVDPDPEHVSVTARGKRTWSASIAMILTGTIGIPTSARTTATTIPSSKDSGPRVCVTTWRVLLSVEWINSQRICPGLSRTERRKGMAIDGVGIDGKC